MKHTWDLLRLLRRGGPALCNIAVTNSCNATCDFCNFANGKIARKDLRWIDASRLNAALEILYGRGIRYVSFFGGEPLLHAALPEMVRMAVARGMGTALITNGWLLPSKLDDLSAAGLKTIYISIDAASVTAHESNRGLKNLVERIRASTIRMQELGDALDSACEGKFLAALKLIANRRNLESLKAVLENASIRSRLARLE